MLDYQPPQCSPEEGERLVAAFREFAAERRQLALKGARAALALERSGAVYRTGASSVAHFAELNGVPANEARELMELGRALENCPSLADDVTTGSIPPASAAILGELGIEQNARGDVGFALEAGAAPMVRADDRWVEWAKTKSTKDFRRLFLRRRDEVRAGVPVIPLYAYVTAAVRENIDRAKALASRSAHAALTLGQTLGVVFDDWLDAHDPMRTKPGTRRVPDTSTLPDSRYVPAEVDRAVRARSEDCCIVPFCDSSIWVHRSHRVPHRSGGSREAGQLDLLCDYHHYLYERGALRIDGPADAPIITDADGNSIDERHPYRFRTAGPPPGCARAAAAGDPGGASSPATPQNPPKGSGSRRSPRRSPPLPPSGPAAPGGPAPPTS